jgi:hypothetical protein
MTMLTIVIGIVFVMLLFSLLATSIMELLAGVFALRGKHLLLAITNMIGDVTQAFRVHPFFEQLSLADLKGKSTALPSYINSGTFSAVLTDILNINFAEEIEPRLAMLPEGKMKDLLYFLYRQTNGEVTEFKRKIEEWYNEVMDRASGAYKRKTRAYLLALGAALAIVFNVDALRVYHNLSMNASLSEYVADMATDYVNNNPAPAPTTEIEAVPYETAKAKIGELVNNNINVIGEPLGLGWNTEQLDSLWNNPSLWWYKLVGWIITAISISLGGAFWFDLLKMLVSIRSSGPPPPPGASTNAGSGLSTTSGSFLTQPGANTPDVSRGAKKAKAPPRTGRGPRPVTDPPK